MINTSVGTEARGVGRTGPSHTAGKWPTWTRTRRSCLWRSCIDSASGLFPGSYLCSPVALMISGTNGRWDTKTKVLLKRTKSKTLESWHWEIKLIELGSFSQVKRRLSCHVGLWRIVTHWTVESWDLSPSPQRTQDSCGKFPRNINYKTVVDCWVRTWIYSGNNLTPH